MRRVVVTGVGVVSALGCDVDTSVKRLRVYKNAVKSLKELEQVNGLHASLAAPIEDFCVPQHYTRKVLRTMGIVLGLFVLDSAAASKESNYVMKQLLFVGIGTVA